MTGRLEEALRNLLVKSLPDLFQASPPPAAAPTRASKKKATAAEATPAATAPVAAAPAPAPVVALSIVAEVFTLDPQSAEAQPGEPRADDQTDPFPFSPTKPERPLTLSKPPLAGPRRVWLTTELGDRVPLGAAEVEFSKEDPRVFRLKPREGRDLSGFNGLEVLYSVSAVFVRLKGTQTLAVQLESDDATQLEQAEALTLAAIELNRRTLIEEATKSFEGGDYGAALSIETLRLVTVTAPNATTRRLNFTVEMAVRAERALAGNEGAPIVRILSPGQSAVANHAVRIDAKVDA